MVVPVLWLVLLIIPAVPVQLGQMLHAGINYQVTALLYPAQLQVDTVQNLRSLVGVIKIIQAALKPLVLAQLRNGRLVRIIYIHILGKSPVLTALLQEGHELNRRVARGKRDVKLGIVVNLFGQGHKLPVLRDSLEYHSYGIRRLGRVGCVQGRRELFKFQCLGLLDCDDMLRPLKVGEYQSGCLTTQALNLILPDFRSFRGIGHYLFQFFLAQAQVMGKRKEPMYPAGFWLLLQFVFNFLWCL